LKANVSRTNVGKELFNLEPRMFPSGTNQNSPDFQSKVLTSIKNIENRGRSKITLEKAILYIQAIANTSDSAIHYEDKKSEAINIFINNIKSSFEKDYGDNLFPSGEFTKQEVTEKYLNIKPRNIKDIEIVKNDKDIFIVFTTNHKNNNQKKYEVKFELRTLESAEAIKLIHSFVIIKDDTDLNSSIADNFLYLILKKMLKSAFIKRALIKNLNIHFSHNQIWNLFDDINEPEFDVKAFDYYIQTFDKWVSAAYETLSSFNNPKEALFKKLHEALVDNNIYEFESLLSKDPSIITYETSFLRSRKNIGHRIVKTSFRSRGKNILKLVIQSGKVNFYKIIESYGYSYNDVIEKDTTILDLSLIFSMDSNTLDICEYILNKMTVDELLNYRTTKENYNIFFMASLSAIPELIDLVTFTFIEKGISEKKIGELLTEITDTFTNIFHLAAQVDNVSVIDNIFRCVKKYSNINKNTIISNFILESDDDGFDSIFHSINNKAESVTKWLFRLIGNNIDWKTKDREGRSYIFSLIDQYSSHLVLDIIFNNSSMLKELKALEINDNQYQKYLNSTDEEDNKILHAAIKNEAKELVYLSLSEENINYSNIDGDTPLSLAIEHFDINLIIKLIERGASINDVDQNGVSILMKAISTESRVIIDLILNEKPNILALDNDGKSVLQYAIETDDVEILKKNN
jgi:hypothetical protein